MSPLRKQMEADMVVRGLAYRTRGAYRESVTRLAKFYGRPPDRISEEEVQRYLLHLLQERKLAHSSCNVMCSALQFFYRVTLKRREAEFCLPRPKVPSRLPEILSREEIAALIPPGDALILVDQAEFGSEIAAGRRPIPFLERGGEYWGPPPDDATAIQEFERLRKSGASFIVFGWPAFWWFGYYPGFHHHLRSTFRCVMENERVVVFDLRR